MRSAKKGFTAVELLISLAILSITLTSVYGLYMSFIRVQTKEGAKIKVQQNVRSSLDMMVRDIRTTGLDPELTGAFGIVPPLDSQRLKFTADRDMDGLLDEPNEADGIDDSDLEYMEYAYDGSDSVEMILRKSDGTEEMRAMLVNDVTDLTFSYFDADDAATSIAEDVRTIEIRMTIRRPAGRAGEVSRTLIKRLKCRNLEFH
ncbi:MAG: type II secretion system protein [Desulfobacterales bacterium]|jgi:prepilin-type N-terminal cleavage/methylation domain-containing protein